MNTPSPSDTAAGRLAHPDPSERMAALEALTLTNDAAALAQAAGDLLADDDPAVRECAGRYLVALGTTEAAARACPYIASPEIGIRNLAGEVLTQIGPPAVPVLAAAIDDPDKDVRKFAIDVLSLLPAHNLSYRIAAHLDDEDPNVRLAAIDALAALGASEHADALMAMYDPEPLARPGIVAALGVFTEHTDAIDPAFFGRALGDDDPVVQFAAAEALSRVHDPSLITLLVDKVHHVDPMARPVVLDSLVGLLETYPDHTAELPLSLRRYFVEMLDDPDSTYVVAAVKGLRFVDAAGTLPEALARTGTNDAVDVEIFTTLTRLPAPLPPLIETTRQGALAPDPAAQYVLGLIMQQALDPSVFPDAAAFLRTWFDALQADTKIAAINLCVHLGDPALFDLLEAGLQDPDPTVQSFAADAAQDVGLTPRN